MNTFTPDTTRTGDAPKPRPRSAARRAMDMHADTGTWIVTTVPAGEAELARRRLYTLAHKAGYSLLTEFLSVPGTAASVRLRFLVTTKRPKHSESESEAA